MRILKCRFENNEFIQNLNLDNLTMVVTEYDLDKQRVLKRKKLVKGTSLFNDSIRVYKGGSWKDVTYWLAPGARRFMHQDSSTNHIGFRCAMVSLGAKGK